MDQFYRLQIQERHAGFHRESANRRIAAAARQVRREAAEDPAKRSMRARLRLLPRVALLVVGIGH